MANNFLKGPRGDKGDSAYQIALKYTNFRGTAIEWLKSLVGKKIILQRNLDKIQYKYEDSETWQDLVSIDELKASATSLDVVISATQPENPTEGMIWLDIS